MQTLIMIALLACLVVIIGYVIFDAITEDRDGIHAAVARTRSLQNAARGANAEALTPRTDGSAVSAPPRVRRI